MPQESGRHSVLHGDYRIDNVILDKADPCNILAVLDCGSLSRVGERVDRLTGGTCTVNIDHHASNAHFGDVNFVDPHASSCGEIIYGLLQHAGIALTPQIADCLYTVEWVPTQQLERVDTSRFPLPDELSDRLRPHLDALSLEREVDRIRELQASPRMSSMTQRPFRLSPEPFGRCRCFRSSISIRAFQYDDKNGFR